MLRVANLRNSAEEVFSKLLTSFSQSFHFLTLVFLLLLHHIYFFLFLYRPLSFSFIFSSFQLSEESQNIRDW